MVAMEDLESRRFGEESWKDMKQKSILLRVNKMIPTEFSRLRTKQFSKKNDELFLCLIYSYISVGMFSELPDSIVNPFPQIPRKKDESHNTKHYLFMFYKWDTI